MANEPEFSFRPKGDHLTIYKGEKKVHTPKGNLVFADNEAMAQRLVEELQKGREVSDLTSVLCYHYTYCDLVTEYDAPAMRRDLNEWVDANLEYDMFVGFNGLMDEDDCRSALTTLFTKSDTRQLVAIIVLLTAFDSVLFPCHIVSDLIHVAGTSTDYETARDEFVKEVEDYCAEAELESPSNLASIIDAFVSYYCK